MSKAIAKALSKERDDYILSMEKYLEFLKSLSKEQSRKLAKESIIRSGIIDEDENMLPPYNNFEEDKNINPRENT